MRCYHCDEDVTDEDLAAGGRRMPLINGPCEAQLAGVHRECLLRSVVGSVGHQMGRCSCHGGEDADPPGMTAREAARAAVELASSGFSPKASA